MAFSPLYLQAQHACHPCFQTIAFLTCRWATNTATLTIHMNTCADAIVNDERGIHARPSALIVMASRSYPGTVTVKRADEPDGPEYDCKDMMALVELDACYQTRVRFTVSAPHELDPSDFDQIDERAQALCRRLVEIVSMTLEQIERMSMPSGRSQPTFRR